MLGSRTGRILITLGVAVSAGLPAGFAVSAQAAAAHRPAPPAPAFSSWLLAGNGTDCTTPPACGDGAAASAAQLGFPTGVAVAPDGELYIADWGDNQIRRVGLDGSISTIAGSGTACSAPPACGDGGAASAAQLSFPAAVAVDAHGNLYIADTEDNEVRKVSPSGTIMRFAGTGTSCARPPACGDGGAARSAQLSAPGGVAVNSIGDVYIADSADHEIRVVTPDGRIVRLAGTGSPCAAAPACGDGGPAPTAQLFRPEGIAVSRSGQVFIADDGDNEVRQIGMDGKISRVAGSGAPCTSAPACGDGGLATSASLNLPDGVAVDAAGHLFIADDGDNEIREVVAGKIVRVAGGGTPCSAPPSCGDGGPAADAQFNYPDAVATDPDGNVYVADTYDSEVRLLTQAQVSRTPDLSAALGVMAVAASRDSVAVRYLLPRSATVTLTVAPSSGAAAVVARVTGQSGWGQLAWNRILGGRPAPRGRYKLTLTATSAGRSLVRNLTVRL